MLPGQVPDPCYADDECRRRVTDVGWWDVEFRRDEPLVLCCSSLTLMVCQYVHQSCGISEFNLSSHSIKFCSEDISTCQAKRWVLFGMLYNALVVNPDVLHDSDLHICKCSW